MGRLGLSVNVTVRMVLARGCNRIFELGGKAEVNHDNADFVDGSAATSLIGAEVLPVSSSAPGVIDLGVNLAGAAADELEAPAASA